ncbi:MAG: S46 family peptidase [Chitinophagales bacterium]
MSDVLYDINRCRNISIDVRYTLFIIDKYANAQNIMSELKLVEQE